MSLSTLNYRLTEHLILENVLWKIMKLGYYLVSQQAKCRPRRQIFADLGRAGGRRDQDQKSENSQGKVDVEPQMTSSRLEVSFPSPVLDLLAQRRNSEHPQHSVVGKGRNPVNSLRSEKGGSQFISGRLFLLVWK